VNLLVWRLRLSTTNILLPEPRDGWGSPMSVTTRISSGPTLDDYQAENAPAMRIAMIGQRGIPATFGGIERAVEELGAQLASRGHEVVVYCRSGYVEGPPVVHRGMTLRDLPTVNSKHLEAFVHTGLATADAMRQGFDILHFHALGPGLFAPMARLDRRTRVVQTIHGLDDQRAKWGSCAQRILRVGAWTSARVPHATIVVSRDLQRHYLERWRRATHAIPNGVSRGVQASSYEEIQRRFGLEPGSYVLFVGRVIPEKAVDLLVTAFGNLDTDLRLVIAGGSSHTDAYAARVKDLADADPRILLTGFVYDETLAQLYSHAAAFVLPSELEGLPLSLLEAASYGVPVVASDIPPHLEILGGEAPGGRLFEVGSAGGLTDALERSLGGGTAEREGARRLRDKVLARYRWDAIAEQTVDLYRDVLSQ
jgi:glycosyltransferase involved in cell wall biosynthesis